MKRGNIVELPDNDLLEEEAARWVMCLDGGEMTPEMNTEFVSWLNRSIRHRQALDQMAAMWGMADMLEQYNRIDTLEEQNRHIGLTPWVLVSGVMAASIVLVISAFLLRVGPWTPGLQNETYQTAIGERQVVELADGSKMILNTNTLATVEIDRELRVVKLNRGEAHFEVAREKRRPFQVYVDQELVQAVGTEFVVRLRDSEVEVTVAEGIVEVFTQNSARLTQSGGKPAEPEWRSLTALSKNESAIFDDHVAHREKLDKPALKKKLLWRDGLLAFSGEPLAEVVAEMSRYTELEISILDPEIRAMPIAGTYEAGNIQGMFDSLERAFGITAERDEKGGVVLSRRA